MQLFQIKYELNRTRDDLFCLCISNAMQRMLNSRIESEHNGLKLEANRDLMLCISEISLLRIDSVISVNLY